ncbi:MAG: acyl-CoA thioesterase-1 [Candidatus Azotimanducaceae bacterium]|jgi:acyl-CoA thioesterase-1
MLIFMGSLVSFTYAAGQESVQSSKNDSKDAGVILVFGDSISAAYGMDQELGWVHLLSERFKKDKTPYRLVNASVSGETTGGGLVRLPKTLDIHQPDIVIIELGGNDGLRGYPISKIQDNLLELTRTAKAAGARVLLVGMVLPPNYGQRYTQAFEKLFTEIALNQQVPVLPFLLDGVSTSRNLLQRDGIHPTAEAQPLLVNEIWPLLEPLLKN